MTKKPKSESQELRDAGFLPRDNRLPCEECGKLLSMQALRNWHQCDSADIDTKNSKGRVT